MQFGFGHVHVANADDAMTTATPPIRTRINGDDDGLMVHPFGHYIVCLSFFFIFIFILLSKHVETHANTFNRE